MAVKEAIADLIKSVDVIVELSASFTSMESDPLWYNILKIVEKTDGMDVRPATNYSLLLHSTAKVCNIQLTTMCKLFI